MKVLLLGSGGREHAIFWKLSQSPLLTSLDVFPGNGGFPENQIIKEAGLSLSDMEGLAAFVKNRGYDFVFVGPEQPLVDGVADALKNICPVFGPDRYAAQLEGSKDFSKSFMEKYRIPAAHSRTFTDYNEAKDYLQTKSLPIVIKADGLAAGKGVTVAETHEQAEQALKESLIDHKFGNSGNRVLIEDFMKGIEASVFALCDGKKALPFIAAKDHKRAFDNDLGPNTGGMGAFAPVSFMTDEVMKKVQEEVLDRVMEGMQKEGHPYRGLLYAGLMVDGGIPRVVEFNVRFGDPETQPLMRLLDEDLLDLSFKAAKGELPDIKLKFKDEAALVVVLAAEGYPDEYKKNILLKDIDRVQGDIIFFHAGTLRDGENLISSGGRILGITATGKDPVQARENVYSFMKNLNIEGTFYRKDIAEREI
ncbi:MAG: phosphoribosylamine--glycine ligase [Spirochaetia bacterium]|nr:phosphoribosylamine--glycine ligase [Spirochaetia bacterium]